MPTNLAVKKMGLARWHPLTDDNIPPHTPALPVQPASPAEILPPGGTKTLDRNWITEYGRKYINKVDRLAEIYTRRTSREVSEDV